MINRGKSGVICHRDVYTIKVVHFKWGAHTNIWEVGKSGVYKGGGNRG